ncbi:MAG: hypothetical protein M3R24_42510 [Chloroflexota bacterium]|nr:hypothetical protein [Chloroflexota bacterium]
MKDLNALAAWVDAQRQQPLIPKGVEELGWIASLSPTCDSSDQAATALTERIAQILSWGEPLHDASQITWEMWLELDINALTMLLEPAMPDDETGVELVKQAISDWWSEIGLEMERVEGYTAELRQLRHAILTLGLWFTPRADHPCVRQEVFETFMRRQLATLKAKELPSASEIGHIEALERGIATFQRIQECQVSEPLVNVEIKDGYFYTSWETPTHRWTARVEPQFNGRKMVMSLMSATSYRRLKRNGFAERGTTTYAPVWGLHHKPETYQPEYDAWVMETLGRAVYTAVLEACRQAITFA